MVHRRPARRPIIALLVAGFIAGIVVGCTPSSIESIRDPEYDRSVENLYMVSAIGEELDGVETTWLQSLSRGLQAAQIRYESERLDFELPDSDVPSLEETSLDVPFEPARTWGATQVLVVEQKGEDVLEVQSGVGSPGAGGRLRTQVFDVSLFDAGTEKRVWRATIQTSDGFGDSDRDKGRSLARKMADTLVEDGLLPQVVADEVPRG